MPELPRRDRIYQNHHLDTTRWNWFTPRDDDIIVASVRAYLAALNRMIAITGAGGHTPEGAVSTVNV